MATNKEKAEAKAAEKAAKAAAKKVEAEAKAAEAEQERETEPAPVQHTNHTLKDLCAVGKAYKANPSPEDLKAAEAMHYEYLRQPGADESFARKHLEVLKQWK